MSGRIAPLLDGWRPSAPHTPPRLPRAAPETHGRAGPDSPWCRCGRPREACVSDEVRILWTPHPTAPPPPLTGLKAPPSDRPTTALDRTEGSPS